MTDHTLRVAYLGSKGLGSIGGVERVVAAIAAHAPAHGIQPTVYGLRAAAAAHTHGAVREIRMPALPGKHLRPVSYNLLCALHAVAFGRYDVVHLHNAEASFVLPLLRLRFPVVATSHGFAWGRVRWGRLARIAMKFMDRPFMRLSTIATSVSERTAHELQGTHGRGVEYVPNCVVAPQPDDGGAAATILVRHGLQPQRYALFATVRFDPTKGADVAIAASNRAAVPLLVIGGGDPGSRYEHALRAAAGPQIVFQPPLASSATFFGLMLRAGCLVFPSTLEAMSMLLLEAANLGTPVVCSDIADNRAVLGDDALYFAPADVEALARQLGWVAANPGRATEIARRARARVAQRFSCEVVTARYAELYRHARNGTNRRHHPPG